MPVLEAVRALPAVGGDAGVALALALVRMPSAGVACPHVHTCTHAARVIPWGFHGWRWETPCWR